MGSFSVRARQIVGPRYGLGAACGAHPLLESTPCPSPQCVDESGDVCEYSVWAFASSFCTPLAPTRNDSSCGKGSRFRYRSVVKGGALCSSLSQVQEEMSCDAGAAGCGLVIEAQPPCQYGEYGSWNVESCSSLQCLSGAQFSGGVVRRRSRPLLSGSSGACRLTVQSDILLCGDSVALCDGAARVPSYEAGPLIGDWGVVGRDTPTPTPTATPTDTPPVEEPERTHVLVLGAVFGLLCLICPCGILAACRRANEQRAIRKEQKETFLNWTQAGRGQFGQNFGVLKGDEYGLTELNTP